MGRSDPHLFPFYNKHIIPKGNTALLGFTDNRMFKGDLYDLQLENWDINSEWKLPRKYDTIISLRCPYFAKDPVDFIKRCSENLNEGGVAYLDWGLGDHWRFENYKVGWVKNGEHEHAYKDDNFLWSCCWDPRFDIEAVNMQSDEEIYKFKKRIEKFGYKGSLAKHVLSEVPVTFSFDEIVGFDYLEVNFLSLWEDLPQLYILLKLEK